MKAAMFGLVVLAALTATWDIHQEAHVAGNSVVCDAEGSATVNPDDPANPTVTGAEPVCSGVPPL